MNSRLAYFVVFAVATCPFHTRGESQRGSETLGHVLLEAELEAKGETQAEFDIRMNFLDLLTSQALSKFPTKPKLTDESEARQILATIDTVLAENDYQLDIPCDSLWAALSKNQGVRGLPYSKGMKRRAKDLGGSYVAKFVFDCDTGSMIYLHILERINAPVCLVETKRHNFVRWRFSDAHYLNWDVNSGDAFEDDDFRKGGVGLSSGFSKEEELAEGFLQDMSREQLMSYHLLLSVKQYQSRQAFDKAIDLYKTCIRSLPKSPTPRNNFAWMIATEPALQESVLLDIALAEATRAVEIRPRDGNIIDTLAATYAARHDFAIALKWERSEHGNKNSARIAAYEDGTKTPSELGWK